MGQNKGLTRHCHVCEETNINELCHNSLKRIGVKKVHWECWSNCNLGCQFCYRSTEQPLDREDALALVDSVADGGAQTIVFAGGDPSLRKDLPELIRYAKNSGLEVEVQTNAHHIPSALLSELVGECVATIGLSLDAATAEKHDGIRSTRGNFKKVLKLLDIVDRQGKNIILRTVISKQNKDEVDKIGPLIEGFSNISRWSLLEFTPINSGYQSRRDYEMPHDEFLATAERASLSYNGKGLVDIYSEDQKKGTYCLIAPDGSVYGTSYSSQGHYPIIGNINSSHMADLAMRLPFNRDNHLLRYS